MDKEIKKDELPNEMEEEYTDAPLTSEFLNEVKDQLLNEYKARKFMSGIRPHADNWQSHLDYKEKRKKFIKRKDAEELAAQIMEKSTEYIFKFIVNAVARKKRDDVIMRDLRRHHIETLHDLCRMTHDVGCEHTQALYEMWYDAPAFIETSFVDTNYFEYDHDLDKNS
jgi:hypothetical protein